MKILLICISLFIISCSGSGGGVTTEPPPPTTPPVIGSLSLANSSFKIFQDNIEITSNEVRVGSILKLQLVARDNLNQLISGLNISYGYTFNILPDEFAVEVSSGVYEKNISFSDQGLETMIVKNDNVSISLNRNIQLTFCLDTPNPSALPFNSLISKNSSTYRVICSPSELASIAGNAIYLNYNFALGRSINLDDYYVDTNMDLVPENQFKIGTTSNPFTGKFDGYGYTISNFKYKGSINEDDIGLFAKIESGAEIRSLILDEFLLNGRNRVGSVAGSVISSSASEIVLDSISVTNFQNDSLEGSDHGGFIGKAEGLSGLIRIENSSAQGVLNLSGSLSSRERIGGFIGHALNIKVDNLSISTIIAQQSDEIFQDVGGLVGKLENNQANNFTNVSATSGISIKSGQRIGGLFGHINNSFLKDFSLISVTLNLENSIPLAFSDLGGYIGLIENSEVENFSGFISNENLLNSFGGFAGRVNNSIINDLILSGLIKGVDDFAGIAHQSINSSFSKIKNSISLESTGSTNIAGFINEVQGASSISQSSYTGEITAENATNVAGMANNYMGGGSFQISNSYVNSIISGDQTVSGIINLNSSSALNESIIIDKVYVSGNLMANNTLAGLMNQFGEYDTISNSFSVAQMSNYSSGLPSVSDVFINERVGTTGSIQNSYFLSSETIETSICSIGDCTTSISVIDTNLANPNDLSYYYLQSNPPNNLFDSLNIWIFSGLGLPTLF